MRRSEIAAMPANADPGSPILRTALASLLSIEHPPDSLSAAIGDAQPRTLLRTPQANYRALGIIFDGNGAPDRSDALKVLYDTKRKQPRVLAQALEIAAAAITANADAG